MTERVRQKDWVLTGEALERLLGALDPDRASAALRYEEIRRRVASFFRWRGDADPEECADRTFDRVARTLEQGTVLQLENPFQYFYAVALNVWRERSRATAGRAEPLEKAAEPAVHPEVEGERARERARMERRLACLEACIARLPEESRGLLLRYHTDGSGRIAARKGLAASLGIGLNTLRIRAYRIRGIVERCGQACLGQRGEG